MASDFGEGMSAFLKPNSLNFAVGRSNASGLELWGLKEIVYMKLASTNSLLSPTPRELVNGYHGKERI